MSVRAISRRTRLFAAVIVGCGVLAVAGRAPADMVSEQRARLPPPVDASVCSDDVEGDWVSHDYDTRWSEWTMFSLRVRRKPGSTRELIVDLANRSWDGTPASSEPPTNCTRGLKHWNVTMTGRGETFPDGRIEIWATSYRIEHIYCDRWGSYNLDHFTGRIDRAIQEFQSVNNDGGRSVNQPTVFRRVRCLEPPPAPHVVVTPPPFYPSRRAAGCSVGW